ncbi:MAG TPA: PmoA family protein [Chryseosolibacter sp.]|nr:PmoA family protein [Chryseosolibacter sp.]
MKLRILRPCLLLLIICISCSPKPEQQSGTADQAKITFKEYPSEKRIDVLIDDKLFTAYRWPDNVYKPILFPLVSAGGATVTRGFPLEPREGERNDHRHQVGNWLNYGNVNGFDFWGNGHSGERSPNGGEIKHLTAEKLNPGAGEASMITTAAWLDPSGKELLKEKTEYVFIAKGLVRMVDRITTLTASGPEPVKFQDTKEGMFGIRVARQMELPSNEEITLTDASGNPTTVKKMSNEGVTGNYRSSEGVVGEKVWSTRARWMNLYGSIGNEKVSLVVCDHPKNISYPTYWHARGYGLFSANPFGAKDFTEGKEELNYTLPAGGSLTFRYRIIVASDSHLTDEEINAFTDDFAKRY